MNIKKERQDEPTSLTHQIIKAYMKLGHLHRDILDKEVRRTGVFRSQHQILMFLSVNPEASQKDIAEFLEVSTATIAVTLGKLEKSGCIIRAADQTDKRCNRIHLTKKGEDIVTHSHEIFYRVEEDMFRGFSEKEKNELKEYFERACSNLEKIYRK